jgi:hypothetical protein
MPGWTTMDIVVTVFMNHLLYPIKAPFVGTINETSNLNLQPQVTEVWIVLTTTSSSVYVAKQLSWKWM